MSVSLHRQRRRAFTLIDLLAVLFIVAMLTAMGLAEGGLTRARESANRVKCGSNLRQVGQGMMLYANENRGRYPRTAYKAGDAPTQYTGVDTKEPLGAESAVKSNDVTAALYLLLRTQDLTAGVFICPSTDAVKYDFGGGAKTAQDHANFPSQANLGYSLANPYADAAAIANGVKYSNTLGADFALAADMNPGTVGDSDPTPTKGPADPAAPAAVLAKGNSLNHRSAGQNVLFGDGHVEWVTTPFAGAEKDNIFTVAGADGKAKTSATIAGSPVSASDSVLLPAATVNPRTKTPAQEEAAAIAEFKQRLPELKARLAAEIKAKGETAELKEAREMIERMEKEANQGGAK